MIAGDLRRYGRWILAALLLPGAAGAQVVRGTVVDATARAISGVVVALVDSSQAVVSRALTDDRGEYRVVAPRAGTYRLHTLRIGYQPTRSPLLVLSNGSVSVERLVLDGVRVTLETVRVVSRSACGRQGSSDAGACFQKIQPMWA